MIERRLISRLNDTLSRFPAVALLGPRQVGKTTLAQSLASEGADQAIYLDLELPSDRAKLSEPELYLSAHEQQLIIFDEIQRIPGIFETLRGVIDQRRRKGFSTRQFLLLGSASIDLLKQSAESLAGRIAYLELTPFMEPEVVDLDAGAVERLWIRGGFPVSFLGKDDAASMEWRDAFLRTYLERDVPALGPRVPAETLRRFWQMLAHNQGQLLNAARLAASLGISGHSIARYLDLLVDLLLVRRLQPWTQNLGKRLVRGPKVYVRDSGLVHALLGVGDREQLLGHPVVGARWEGFVIENIVQAAPPGATGWFYRTADGAEIDLLLEFAAGDRWAVEVKRSLGSPHPSKGFHIACEDVKARKRYVVYPGTERYQIAPDTEAIPLTDLLALFHAPKPDGAA